jgi:formylmethanofuran dehydrogenase subunit E
VNNCVTSTMSQPTDAIDLIVQEHLDESDESYLTVHFESLLELSQKSHGHICPRQTLGLKMSILGLNKIGIANPKGTDKKNIMVFVEMDRCATDEVQSVTGCSLGHRTMKFLFRWLL